MSPSPLKAIILAAGAEPALPPSAASDAATPWPLRMLGDRPVLDYVVELARNVAQPQDMLLVVSQHSAGQPGDVACFLQRQYPHEPFQFVEQKEPLGTGHAVLQTLDALKGYGGDLLILHGDSPFFRRSSILGLIRRHRVKQADVTLMSGITQKKIRSARLLRAQNNLIVDVIEEEDASPAVQQITEFNMGAYVVKAPLIWPVLQELTQIQAAGAMAKIHFTDCIRRLIRSGSAIENYQVLDEDELQDINTVSDLETAALILQKRQLRPRRIEERNIIRFGTGGWRALIGEGFTLDNVRRLCQALANDIARQNREADGVLIGYDRRFLADVAARAAAEVFAGNGIPCELQTEPAPTPLITYATARLNAAYGLMFTASHNPAEWNGLKVFASDGSLPLDEATRAIANVAKRYVAEQVVKVDLETALHNGIVRRVDYTNEYIDAVEALIDLPAIRKARLRVVVDPMYGVGQNALETILTEARCRVNAIHARHDPLFGGRSPAPDLNALSLLISTVRENNYHLGLAMDGDADRIAIVDDRGAYITTNELLLLLYFYLHEVRGQRGGVTRNLATTHLLDRLAHRLGEQAYEVPVGFKHIAASMKEHNVLLAGESSGGLSIRGHILGKDGIFACALVVEMMAITGRSIGDMLAQIYEITGRLYSAEVNTPATPDMKVIVPRKLNAAAPTEIAGYAVRSVSTRDGAKFYLDNDNWLLLRFSGTEPLLRIFAEADRAEKVDELIRWAKELVGN
ncbi:MAG: NTP transferase domain-containing protein [Caldilineaceae bacterium]